MSGRLVFRLITPGGILTDLECTGVTLVSRDGDGVPGGSLGIKYGHLPAVIALADRAAVRASGPEGELFSTVVKGGFAHVKDNTVTVVTQGTEP